MAKSLSNFKAVVIQGKKLGLLPDLIKDYKENCISSVTNSTKLTCLLILL